MTNVAILTMDTRSKKGFWALSLSEAKQNLVKYRNRPGTGKSNETTDILPNVISCAPASQRTTPHRRTRMRSRSWVLTESKVARRTGWIKNLIKKSVYKVCLPTTGLELQAILSARPIEEIMIAMRLAPITLENTS